MHSKVSGIYGILPADLTLDDMLARAEAAMRGGVRILQLRDKKQGFKYKQKRAQALRTLTRDYQTQLIINDSIALAAAVAADGVHLGKDDLRDIHVLRDEVPNGMILGVTCRADVMMARQVLGQGANYISFGAIFPTESKPDVPVIGLARLQKARSFFFDANIIAIGGITEEAIPVVRKAGADSAAVISSLFASNDIEATAIRMVAAWNAVQ